MRKPSSGSRAASSRQEGFRPGLSPAPRGRPGVSEQVATRRPDRGWGTAPPAGRPAPSRSPRGPLSPVRSRTGLTRAEEDTGARPAKPHSPAARRAWPRPGAASGFCDQKLQRISHCRCFRSGNAGPRRHSLVLQGDKTPALHYVLSLEHRTTLSNFSFWKLN